MMATPGNTNVGPVDRTTTPCNDFTYPAWFQTLTLDGTTLGTIEKTLELWINGGRVSQQALQLVFTVWLFALGFPWQNYFRPE